MGQHDDTSRSWAGLPLNPGDVSHYREPRPERPTREHHRITSENLEASRKILDRIRQILSEEE
jgi:hypothetical protein